MTINQTKPDFDSLVDEVNDFYARLEDPEFKRRRSIKNFLIGMGSVLDIFPTRPKPMTHRERMAAQGNPLYKRTDVADSDRNLVNLASDLKRVQMRLEKQARLLGPQGTEEAGIDHEIATARRMYDGIKWCYENR